MSAHAPVVGVELPSDPSAIAAARRALEDIRDAVPEDVFDDVRLLVSELVTNSVRHAATDPRAPIEVSVRVSERVVHGEITDRGPGFTAPARHAPATVEGSGWGLFLVEHIADRWGTRSDGGRSCVWFDIDMPPA